MAKARPELCMFCGESPCVCTKPNPPKSRRSREVTSTPASPTFSTERPSEPTSPSVEPTDIFKDVSIPIAKSAFKKRTQTTSERDLSYLSALRNLWYIVTPDEQKKIDAEVRGSYSQSLDKKIVQIKKEMGGE
jgi:hypothetical protein